MFYITTNATDLPLLFKYYLTWCNVYYVKICYSRVFCISESEVVMLCYLSMWTVELYPFVSFLHFCLPLYLLPFNFLKRYWYICLHIDSMTYICFSVAVPVFDFFIFLMQIFLHCQMGSALTSLALTRALLGQYTGINVQYLSFRWSKQSEFDSGSKIGIWVR